MASVKVISEVNPHFNAIVVGRDKWPLLMEGRRLFCKHDIKHDCRQLLFFIEDAAEVDWMGFGSRDGYIKNGLGLDPDLAQWAIDGLRKLDPKEAVGLDEAVVLGQREIGIEGGKAGPGRGHKTDGNTKRFNNDATYVIARLRRDRPDLAEQVINGELSANAAAVQAGFRIKTITVPLDPERAARVIRKNFTDSDIQSLVEFLIGD